MAKPGDVLTDFVTAAWYNEVTARTRRSLGVQRQGAGDQNQYVTVYNHSTERKRPWDIVCIGAAKVDYAVPIDPRHSEVGFTTRALSGLFPHDLAILQEPLPGEVGASAKALVSGCSWCWMPSAPDWFHDEPWLVSVEGTSLVYGNEGRIEVIRYFDTPTGFLCFAVIGKLQKNEKTELVEFVITSGPTTETAGPYTGLQKCTATVKGTNCKSNITRGSSITVYDHSGCNFDEPAMTGYTGWAWYSVFDSLTTDAAECHWSVITRCCSPNSGTYTPPPSTP